MRLFTLILVLVTLSFVNASAADADSTTFFSMTTIDGKTIVASTYEQYVQMNDLVKTVNALKKLKAKGNYFILSGKSPFSHLIYPVPFVGGLGIHSTLDFGGQTKFGPDAQWIENPDYVVDESRIDGFYESIRRFWPGLPDGALSPGYVGVRPKLNGPEVGKYIDDFLIQGPAENGVPGLVNLFGIESPGLTSSLAIAEDVLGLLQAR